jgi:hypothetical protein
VTDFFQTLGTETLQQIYLLDQNGVEVERFATSEKIYDIHELASGIYTLILKFTDNETKHVKIVKL